VGGRERARGGGEAASKLDSWAANGTGRMTKHVILCHVSRRQISSPGLGSTHMLMRFFLSNEI
jgi:hypothetical protein